MLSIYSNGASSILCNLQAAAIQYKLTEFSRCGRKEGLVITDQIEIPLPGRIADLKDFDIQPQEEIHVWNHRDSESLGHQTGNYLVLLCFTGYLRMLSNLSEQSVYYLP